MAHETDAEDAGEPRESKLAFRDWHFSVDQEGIGWAIFDREGQSANALGTRPLQELGEIIDWAEEGARRRTMCGLVILSGKEKGFIVGADINEFESFESEAQVIDRLRLVLSLFDRIERLPIPVVAGIHGVCVGGGFELVLACHYRIATRDEGTRVGFPEVKLGIFPGWHGTARSIRQAGPVSAMQAMLTGSMISATRARAMGFVDELVASRGALRWAARKAVLKKRKSKPAGLAQQLLTRWPARALLAKRMRDETKKKAREAHYPAPFRLIDLFEQHGGDLDALKAAETRYFAPLLISEQSRNLRRVFKLSELLKAQAPKDLKWKPLRVHVIGAGTMGADIAGWCVASGMEVTLQDLSAE
ncbi:MAG: enoyl-CoA hydratase-related protein, partial [Hyphomicrobium sp.]